MFVNEPLLDWDIRAAADIKSGNYGSMDEEESQTVSYAKNKIDSLRQKLNRVNPVHITLDLVEKNKFLSQKKSAACMRSVKEVVRGCRGSKRKEPDLAQKNLASVLDQVDILIDMASTLFSSVPARMLGFAVRRPQRASVS